MQDNGNESAVTANNPEKPVINQVAAPTQNPPPPPPPAAAPARNPGMELPPPQVLDPERPRLPLLGGDKFGATPRPTPATLREFEQFVEGSVDPSNTLDLIVGRPRLLLLKQAPKRIFIPDDRVAAQQVITDRQLAITGRQSGTTVLTLWFADPKDANKEKALSYLVRVLPDPEAKERIESVYKELAREINDAFPNSSIGLNLVGDKLVLSGQAHDILEAMQILRIVRANAPGQVGRLPVNQVNLNVSVPPTDVNAPAEESVDSALPTLQNFLAAGGPNIINLLRVPGEQQVMLKVTVAEVNRAAARSIGLNFSVKNNQGITVFANTTGLGNSTAGGTSGNGNVGDIATTLLGIGNLPFRLDNGHLNFALTALQNLSYAKSLAEPNLVTLNGQTASFQAGGEFPVPVVTGATATGLQGVSYVPYGVQVQFVPYITDRDRIKLRVQATVSTRDLATAQTNINGAGVPSLTTRNVRTVVELRQGETLAVAGLIQNNVGAEAARVPFIADVPFLGRLASNDNTSASDQELVMLVTPELVHPLCQKELPPLPGADLFEPSDLEFYLCGRFESRRPYDYRSTIRNDIYRKCRYHHCEDVYILGPHGHSDGRSPAPPPAPAVPVGSGPPTSPPSDLPTKQAPP
jgi:pilus assembly protein CpaC